jgi:hypothetical protein
MSDIKVFQINDCDWVAAQSMDEAKSFYLTQMNPDEDFSDSCELTPEDMDRVRFHDEDKPDEVVSFRQQLDAMIAAGEIFPQFFASTEY